MKTHLFAPLPQDRGEIAIRSIDLARALGTRATVVLWTSHPVPPAVAHGFSVQHFDPVDVAWPPLNDADATTFVIGDDPHLYGAIFAVARRMPGLVILQDARVDRLLAHDASQSDAGREFYMEALRRHHGADALAEGTAFLSGSLTMEAMAHRYPMIPAVLESALAVLVRDAGHAEALRMASSTLVRHLPRGGDPMPELSDQDRVAAEADAIIALLKDLPLLRRRHVALQLARRTARLMVARGGVEAVRLRGHVVATAIHRLTASDITDPF